MRTPVYPSPQEMASVLLRESIRHRNDAHCLIDAARYPAAIASAHKAQELAVKAALEPLGFTKNPEYPFHDALSPTGNIALLSPSDAITLADAIAFFNLAREVTLALQALYSLGAPAVGETIPLPRN